MKVLHIDDHPLILMGIEQLIKKNFPNALFIGCDNKQHFLNELKRHCDLDIIIADLKVKGFDDLEILKPIQLNAACVPVLLYSSMPDSVYALRALKLGASGFLNKIADQNEIISAIQYLLMGKKYVSQEIKESLFSDLSYELGPTPFERLTSREFQIINKVLEGYSTKEICKAFNLKSPTVSTHKTNAFEKLQVTNLIELQNLATIYEL
jgi:two-component system, NarL family, invasion response regulator UvrY